MHRFFFVSSSSGRVMLPNTMRIITIMMMSYIVSSSNTSSSVWGYYTVEDTCTEHAQDVTTFHLGTCVLGNFDQIRCFGYMLSPILAFSQGFSNIRIGKDISTTGNALTPVFLSDVENPVYPVSFAKTGSFVQFSRIYVR